jgi:hypothetical protein
LISFDAGAVEAHDLLKASHAVLFFDKQRKCIGVKPTDNPSDEGALPLNRRRRSVSLKAPHFFQTYALTFDSPQRFDVDYEPSQDLITIDVKAVRRRRGRRPKSA